MKKKFIGFFILTVLALLLVFIYDETRLNDGKLHVVFCDVGQGDAIFIRTPNKTDILVDGGPDKSVLSCLSSHMPFWDRKIDILLLTHPHQDHFAGFFDVLASYNAQSFLTEKLVNKSQSFAELTKILAQKAISVQYLSSGTVFKTLDGVRFQIVGPSSDFLSKTSPDGEIGESAEFASLETLVSFGENNFLLTGDSQAEELTEAIHVSGLTHIDIIQVPHHGSKTGLTNDILSLITPQLAVISVGKKNRYGHPSGETMRILRDYDIRILRTDENGEVELVSDGKKWHVIARNEHSE